MHRYEWAYCKNLLNYCFETYHAEAVQCKRAQHTAWAHPTKKKSIKKGRKKKSQKTFAQPPVWRRVQRPWHHIPPSPRRTPPRHSMEHNIPNSRITFQTGCESDPPVSHVALGVGEPLTSCCLGVWLQCKPLSLPLPLGYPPLDFPKLTPSPTTKGKGEGRQYATDCRIDTCPPDVGLETEMITHANTARETCLSC